MHNVQRDKSRWQSGTTVVETGEGQMAEQNSGMYVVDPNTWETMTGPEREKYLDELLRTKKNFILNGVRYVEDLSLGPVSMSFGGSSARKNATSIESSGG
jgi:hypothetical protein